MLPENQVPGAGSGVTETPVTPTPASEVAVTPATITPPQVDVEALKVKYERDINQLKSSLQRQTAQVSKEWQDRYNGLQNQMHQARMSTMTGAEREKYERQLESEEMQSLQTRLAEIENEKSAMASTVSAFSFFIQQGVPAEKLNLTDGYDQVVSAGWQHLTDELSQLRSAKSNPQPQQPVQPAPLPQAPEVVTDKGIPASGTTWAALRAIYGTDEAVYRAVEEGRLDPSIIPTN